VGQAAQQCPVGVEQVQHAAVEADGDASGGEVVADGVLPAGEADQADGVDETVDLDGSPQLELAGGDRGRSSGTAAVGEELTQVGGGPLSSPSQVRNAAFTASQAVSSVKSVRSTSDVRSSG
jgi:hypothetical protein